MQTVTVVVDVFEPASGVPLELQRLGVRVLARKLPVGDYDVGAGTLIERKTASDLVLSLRSGRLWRQLGNLRRRCPFPVLLVEGRASDWRLGEEASRGLVLAVVDQGVVLLSSENPGDSAMWIAALARRRQYRVPRDRPPYTYRPRLPAAKPGEAMLCAIEGISVHHARRLLDTFGTVRGVVQASPGIG